MKRFAILAIAAVSVALAGCGGDEPDELHVAVSMDEVNTIANENGDRGLSSAEEFEEIATTWVCPYLEDDPTMDRIQLITEDVALAVPTGSETARAITVHGAGVWCRDAFDIVFPSAG